MRYFMQNQCPGRGPIIERGLRCDRCSWSVPDAWELPSDWVDVDGRQYCPQCQGLRRREAA